MSQHIFIADPEYSQAELSEGIFACAVIVKLGLVNAAVDLDDKPGRMAVEIDHEAPDDLLTPEMHPQLVSPKLTP